MKTTQRTIIVTRDKGAGGQLLIWTRWSDLKMNSDGVWWSTGPYNFIIIRIEDIKAIFGRIPRKGGKLVFRVEAV